MAERNDFKKYNTLAIIAAGLLYMWFFYSIDLSETKLLSGLGTTDSSILSTILVTVLLFFLLMAAYEYVSINGHGRKLETIYFVSVIIISLGSLLTSYPKLVLNTCLRNTSRSDFLIPVIIALVATIGSISLIMILYGFRDIANRTHRSFLKVFGIWTFIAGLVFLIGVGLFVFTAIGLPSINIIVRTSTFVITVLGISIAFTIKIREDRERNIDFICNWIRYCDRNIELFECDNRDQLENIFQNKRSHNRIMKLIEKKKDYNIFPRFQFLKEIQFRPVHDKFEPVSMDDDDPVLQVAIIREDDGSTMDLCIVKIKYIKAACQQVRVPAGGNYEVDFLSPMGLLAYCLQKQDEVTPEQQLHLIAESGTVEELQELFKKYTLDVNYQNYHDGWSPLHAAVASGIIENVKFLLQKAADPNISNKLGLSPIFYSVLYGNLAITKMLIGWGANVNHQDPSGFTPLMASVKRGHNAIVRCLLDAGGDKNKSDFKNMTAKDYALKGNHGSIARLLREHSPDEK